MTPPARSGAAAAIAKGCLAAGCLGSVGACLAAISLLVVVGSWLGEGGAPPTPVGPGYTPGIDPHEFERSEEGAAYRLSFGFADHHGRVHRVSCRVLRRDLERELEAFGFAERELWPRFNRRVQERLEQEARSRGLERYFTFTTRGRGEYRWQWRIPGSVPEPELTQLADSARELARWIETRFPEQYRRIEAELMGPHGFRVEPEGGLLIDYARLAESGTRTLAECQSALVTAGAGSSWRQYLGLFLGFFQSLRYEVPPEEEGGRYQLGLWVPTQVLVRGRGDCDSKSVALTAMLRRFGRRVLFILLPRHALIGVEMTPGPGERWVRLGNRYFVLCDAAGPARIPPGGQAISGDYRYVLIEPDGV